MSFWVTCFSFTVFTCHRVKLFSPPAALLIASYSQDYQRCRCFHSNCSAGSGNWAVVGPGGCNVCAWVHVWVFESICERERHGKRGKTKKKKKNTWELVSIFTTETRLTAHSSWPFAHRACTHTHTVTIPTGGKKCSEKELSLTVCKWWTKPYGLCSSAVAFSLLVRSCAATIHCCSLPCDRWWHYYSPGLSWKMCGVNHLSKQAVCRQRGVLAGTIPILKTLSEHTGN